MPTNYPKLIILIALILLGVFFFVFLRAEFLKEKTALETEMHLRFVEDLIGLKKSDIKNFFRKKNKGVTQNKLTVYDSIADRRITFFSDSFSTDLKDSIKLIIRDGILVWNTNLEEMKIKRIDAEPSYHFDSVFVEKPSDTVKKTGAISLIETSSDQFKKSESQLNRKALRGILGDIGIVLVMYSQLLLGFYLLQKNHRDQRALLENKNVLIRNITHELQTPIATIAVALEAIQNFNINEDKVKTNEYINTSRSQLKNLSDSIDRVMQMSKMDDQKEVFHFEKTSIQKLVVEVAEDLKLQIASKKASIEVLSKVENSELSVDKYHFKNVLFNLLDNALKYGKESGNIKVILESSDSNFLIKIKDDGTGIAVENQEKVFERFYRISEGNRHNVKGYGLGLSYAKQVVEAHRGEISLESQPEMGSTFIITIPKIR